MGGSNSPESEVPTRMAKLAMANHHKIDCIDDYVRQQHESYLSANPNIIDQKCKILELYQRMWKQQSKINQVIQEIQNFLDKTNPVLKNLMSRIHGHKYIVMEHCTLFIQLYDLHEDVDFILRTLALRLIYAKIHVHRMERRIIHELMFLIRDEHSSQSNNRILHPDLTHETILEFFDNSAIFISSVPQLQEELLQLRKLIMQELNNFETRVNEPIV